MALNGEEPENSELWDLPELDDTRDPWSGEDLLLYLLYLSQTGTGRELPFACGINGVLIRYVVYRNVLVILVKYRYDQKIVMATVHVVQCVFQNGCSYMINQTNWPHNI